MAEVQDRTQDHMLPVWQRLAWMAAIWAMSVGAMALVSLAIKAWLT